MSKADTFIAKATKEGGLQFTEYNRVRFRSWLKDNAGIWVQIKPLRAESTRMRRFFEGAVVPLCTFYQENLDHHNPRDLWNMREWLKIEFNGQMVVVHGKKHVIAKSTSGGSVLPDFIERVIAWMQEQGYKTELLNPADYRHWRDVIFPIDPKGIDTYIDYLLETKKLSPLYH